LNLNAYLETKNPSIRRVFIVTGTGFEPATSGLWASRSFYYFKLAGRRI